MMTREEEQARERAARLKQFADEMVAEVRRRLFDGVPEKVWWQNRQYVLKAVTEPADYLHERGAALPASRYRDIIREVIRSIEAHGDLGRIRRMAFYFLDCVQKHMRHQGDRYYEEGKHRTISPVVKSEMKRMQVREESVQVTAVLAGVRADLVKSNGGRRKKAVAGIQEQRELF